MLFPDALEHMKILTIDDDQWIRNSLTYYFRKKTRAFVALESAEQALEVLKNESFDIVICDYKLPGMDGLDFFRRLTAQHPEVLTVLITAYATDEVMKEVHDLGIDEFVRKPFTTNTIEECFARILGKQETRGPINFCS